MEKFTQEEQRFLQDFAQFLKGHNVKLKVKDMIDHFEGANFGSTVEFRGTNIYLEFDEELNRALEEIITQGVL